MSITITITGDTALDVFQAMRQLVPATPVVAPAPPGVKAIGPDSGETVEPPPGPTEEPAKPKRRRRTKAEMQAENIRNEAKKDLSGADTIRGLLKEIEEKHGAVGIAKASGLMKVVLDDQGADYDKVKVSNVEEARVWGLVHEMKALLEEDADE